MKDNNERSTSKKVMHSLLILFLSGVALVAACSPSNTTTVAAKQKVKKKTIVVMEGATRLFFNPSVKTTCKIANKSKVAILKNKQSTFSKVAPGTGMGGYGYLLKGKKAGKTKIVTTNREEKVTYTVTVISKKKVKSLAKKALSKYTKYETKEKQYLYRDFNGDGVKEIYYNGSFIYYNYAVKKVVTKKLDIKNLKTLYINPKNKMLFAITKEDRGLYGEKTIKNDTYVMYGNYIFFNEEKVFDFTTNVQIAKYVDPKEYVPNYLEGDYYFLHVNNFDQDDFWYKPYTQEELENRIQKEFPQKIDFNEA